MSEFKGVRAFLMIPVGIARDQDLLDNSKSILLMGEILSMLNVTGEFFMSNAELAKRLKTTPRTIKRYLILLESKGLIKRTNVYADKEKKVVVGRKITAGDTLGTYMSLGWGQARHEGGDINVTRVVTPTSPKYNKLKDQHNRTVNKSSSKSSSKDEKDNIKNQNTEEDPKREKIYKSLFQIARMNDQWKGTRTIPTPDQVRQLRMLLYQCDYISLDAILQVFTEKMKSDQLFEPWKYVLKLMRDKVATQKNFESWG